MKGRSIATIAVAAGILALLTAGVAFGAVGDLTYQGCITGETESGPPPPPTDSGACLQIPSAASGGTNSGLQDPNSLAVTSDGRSLYSANESGTTIARFDRDPATGALSYQGCITGDANSGPAGNGACTAIPSALPGGGNSGLDDVNTVVASADGRSLYAAAEDDTSVARFDRDPATGALFYQGCMTGEIASGPAGSGACAPIATPTAGGVNSGFEHVQSLALSSDGESLYSVSDSDTAIGMFDRNPATGAIAYLGCITGETESGPPPPPTDTGACAQISSAAPTGTNSGLDEPRSIAVTADGMSLYAAAFADDAVARFSRDPATGLLSYQGCVTGETESGPAGSGACAAPASASAGGVNSGLDGLFILAVAVSADGRSLYAASDDDDAIARFDRDPATGALSYQGCITGEAESGPTGSGACGQVPSAVATGANSGLDGLRAVIVSPGGASVYVTSVDDSSLVRFGRDPATGALSYQGCTTGETESGPAGSGACAAIPITTAGGDHSGLEFLTALAVSLDGTSLYAASSGDHAIARFDREPEPLADTDPPETTITDHPKNKVKTRKKKAKAKFEFAADEPASFQCKLDKGEFEPCEPTEKFKVKKGKHKLKVRAMDVAGNVDPTPATDKWRVKKKKKK